MEEEADIFDGLRSQFPLTFGKQSKSQTPLEQIHSATRRASAAASAANKSNGQPPLSSYSSGAPNPNPPPDFNSGDADGDVTVGPPPPPPPANRLASDEGRDDDDGEVMVGPPRPPPSEDFDDNDDYCVSVCVCLCLPTTAFPSSSLSPHLPLLPILSDRYPSIFHPSITLNQLDVPGPHFCSRSDGVTSSPSAPLSIRHPPILHRPHKTPKMSGRGPVTDVPAQEQPDQVNGRGDKDQQELPNEMYHDEPTPSKTVNHIYNYPMVHQLCGHLLEWTIPRWGYLLTEAYTQKVVKPIVDVGLKFPGANIVTRVADTIDGYSNGLLDNVDIMFPITTKSAQHNWEDAKSAVEHVKDAFRSDLQKMGDTVPNRAKAVLTTTIRCGSSVVVTFSDSIVKVSAKANQFVQEGTDKLRRNGQQALDATRKRGHQFYDSATKRLDKVTDGAQALSNEAQQKIQSKAKEFREQTEDLRNQTEDIENRTNGQSGSMTQSDN